MSKEQEPIRSRRELRQAWEAQQQGDGARSYPSVPPVPAPGHGGVSARPPRPASAPGNADADDTDATPAPFERSSQARARNRAALRAMKELAEKQDQLSAADPLPSRRALRLQQLEAERAPITAFIPVVPQPGAPEGTAVAGAEPVVSAKSGPASVPDAPGRVSGPAVQGGRRDRRAREVAGQQAPAGSTNMTPGQAEAARELLVEQAKNQIAMMEAAKQQDPTAVDPAILAEQTALAERAAAINRRPEAGQPLAEESPADKPSRNDPAAAHNLAMVTPLEFIRVPGMDRPILRPPATSHVPVVTSPNARLRPARSGSKRAGKAPAPARADKVDAGDTSMASQLQDSRSRVLARAEAVAKARRAEASRATLSTEVPSDEQAGLPPVPAGSAHGLEPLDAATAGLGRLRRNRLMQLAVLAVGVVALIAGLTMIISGLGR